MLEEKRGCWSFAARQGRNKQSGPEKKDVIMEELPWTIVQVQMACLNMLTWRMTPTAQVVVGGSSECDVQTGIIYMLKLKNKKRQMLCGMYSSS